MPQFKSKNQQLIIDRELPHNFIAEKTILSCLLVSSEAIEIAVQNLSVDSFYFMNHQELYKCMICLYENQSPVDVVTVLTFLQDNGLMEKAGGVGVLLDLSVQLPNPANMNEYVRLVNDKFVRRSLIKAGYETVNASYITNIVLENLFTEFETKIFNLANQVKKQKLFSAGEIVKDIFYDLKQKSLTPGSIGLFSGFYALDTLIQGFQKSDLIIIAGRPSMGKTAISLNIALNVIKKSKVPVLFLSLEMSKEQIMYRLITMETNINQINLRSGQLLKDDWAKLSKIMKIFSKIPLFINDTSDLSIQDIRSKLKTIVFEQGSIGLVIIDYLQLMQNSKLKTENRVQELSQITRSLKIIAKEFNVPIIALSQLSRNIETRVDKTPLLSDLRESGSIEQDADIVLMLSKNLSERFLNRENQNYQLIELIIAKHRNGPTGTVQLKFDKKQTRFSNIETK
jgi:replicative DNA helicase